MHELPDFSRLSTAEACRRFKAMLGPEGLMRLAELEAQARPVKKAKRADARKVLLRHLREAARLLLAVGWDALVPVAHYMANTAAKFSAGERREEARAVPARRDVPSQNVLFPY